jgi:uncharacterized membrane protein YcjF (UPF0283 family)
MERLMARNRKTTTQGEVCWLPEKQEPAAAEPKPTIELPQTLTAASNGLPESARAALPGPSHTQDKATVRADLDSLRNIANSAARSAIAKYTSKSTREKLLFRALMFTIAIVLAAVLLTSGLWGNGNYVTLGLCALAASLALGLDILMQTKALRTQHSQRVASAKRVGNVVESGTGKSSQ